MITLKFSLAGVLLLAEHAIAATTHQPSMDEVLDGATPTPGLWLVGGMGVFLMSNGIDTPAGGNDAGGMLVVYAEGYRTRADWVKVAATTGRADDIRIVLPLLDAHPGQAILHEALTASTAAGATDFVIELWAHQARWQVPTAGNGQVNR
jgi:hypothetical protein